MMLKKCLLYIFLFGVIPALAQDSINKIEVFYNPVYIHPKFNNNLVILDKYMIFESININYNSTISNKFSISSGVFYLKTIYSGKTDTTLTYLNSNFKSKEISFFIKILINYNLINFRKNNFKLSLGVNKSIFDINYTKAFDVNKSDDISYYDSGFHYYFINFELSGTYTFYPIKHFGIMARPFISTPSFGTNDLTYGLGIGITYR